MPSELITLFVILLLIAALAVFIRRVTGMHKRGLAYSQEAIDGMTRRIALAEENLAVNRKLVEQGDETIALLQAIRDNLEHRTLKN